MNVITAGTAIMSAVSLTWANFLGDVLSAVQGFGGLTWSLKIAVVVMIIVGLMKITTLSPLWAKLGPYQALLAPALGLVLGVLMLGSGMTASGIFAYMASGAGAVLLNEMLQALTAMPWITPAYANIISIIESFIPGAVASPTLLAKRAMKAKMMKAKK